MEREELANLPSWWAVHGLGLRNASSRGFVYVGGVLPIFLFSLICFGSSWSSFFIFWQSLFGWDLNCLLWRLSFLLHLVAHWHRSKFTKICTNLMGHWEKKGKGRTCHILLEGLLAIFHELSPVWGVNSWLLYMSFFTDQVWGALFLFQSHLFWSPCCSFSVSLVDIRPDWRLRCYFVSTVHNFVWMSCS